MADFPAMLAGHIVGQPGTGNDPQPPARSQAAIAGLGPYVEMTTTPRATAKQPAGLRRRCRSTDNQAITQLSGVGWRGGDADGAVEGKEIGGKSARADIVSGRPYFGSPAPKNLQRSPFSQAPLLPGHVVTEIFPLTRPHQGEGKRAPHKRGETGTMAERLSGDWHKPEQEEQRSLTRAVAEISAQLRGG